MNSEKKYTVLRITVALLGLGFIIASMIWGTEDHNYFLPIGLALVVIANVINAKVNANKK